MPASPYMHMSLNMAAGFPRPQNLSSASRSLTFQEENLERQRLAQKSPSVTHTKEIKAAEMMWNIILTQEL